MSVANQKYPQKICILKDLKFYPCIQKPAPFKHMFYINQPKAI